MTMKNDAAEGLRQGREDRKSPLSLMERVWRRDTQLTPAIRQGLTRYIIARYVSQQHEAV